MKTKLTITVSILTALASVASAQAVACGKHVTRDGSPIPSAAYEGSILGKGDAVLFVRSLPGRAGSYEAIRVGGGKADLYLVDPMVEGSMYSMTLVNKTDEGDLGIVNDDPSLVVTLDGSQRGGLPGFTVMPANSGNKDGFQGTVRFKAGHLACNTLWTDLIPGAYKSGNARLTVSKLDLSRQASVTLTGHEKLNGMFTLRETLPGVYSLLTNQVTDTGVQVDPQTVAFVFFINGRPQIVSQQGYWSFKRGN